MAVVGREKGRRFAEIDEATLLRPGQLVSLEFSNIINLVDNVSISDVIPSSQIEQIADTVEEALKNSTVEKVFQVLYKQALEDRQFCLKLALVCSDYKLLSIKNTQLRRVLLGTTQKNYEDREEVKKRNLVHFHNSIVFLGELYNSLQISGPMQFLALPLLDYLNMLLDVSEEEDIDIVMTQISINGPKIYKKCPDELEELIIKAKLVLINRNLSAKSRGMLLYIIEMANKNFTALSKKLQEFYVNELGAQCFMYIHRYKNSLLDKFKPMNKIEQLSIVENSDGIIIKANKQGANLEFESDRKILQSTHKEKLSVPRAIRGTGAADSIKDKNNKKSPRGKKDKLSDEKMWSSKQNTSSKVWGHDDRFDKDYD